MKKHIILIAISMILNFGINAQVYVDLTATGSNDGSSWANAFTDIQSGIDAASLLGGGEVWVVANTYHATNGTVRSISIAMKADVAIYGGFIGTETTLSQRDWVVNETILSGDIGVQGDHSDNTFHIVRPDATVTRTGILDGFTIRDARVEGGLGGGGMYNINTSPTVRNCKFVDNIVPASLSGGDGAAIYNSGSYPLIENCIFTGNSTVDKGSAIYNFSGLAGTTEISNCLFYNNNTSISTSGAVILNNGSNISITGSTITDNNFGLVHSGGSASNLSAFNNIFWDNGIADIRSTATSTFDSNLYGTEIGVTGSGNIVGDPLFTDPALFDYSLLTCSPATNAGDNFKIPSTNTTDLDSNPRIFGSTVDMGAYELQVVAGGPISLDALETTNIDCFGESTGSISLNASGGGGTLEYSVDGGLTYSSTTIYTSLMAGTYGVSIRDVAQNACIYTESVTLTEPGAAFGIISLPVTDLNCFGELKTLTITCLGGVRPYEYSLDGGANFIPWTDPLSYFTDFEVSSGSYTILTRDANGCSDSQMFTINEPALLQENSFSLTDVNCNGEAEGTITIGAMGGTTPYEFAVTGAYQSSGTFTNLAAGNYTVLARDNNLCTFTKNFTITEPTAISSSSSTTNILCNEESTGDVTFNASGGTPPYEYSLDGTNFQSSGLFTGLVADDYTMTIRDASGCLYAEGFSLTEPDALSTSLMISNPLCSGDSNGEIMATVSGGTSPYEYSIDGANFQSSDTFTGLSGDDYTVTIRDANGCLTTDEIALSEPAILSLTSSFDGSSVSLIATGGTSPYTYSSDGTTFQSSDSFVLANGNYTFTVKDANDCEAVTSQSLVVTAVDDGLENQLSVYPNPVNSVVNIEGVLNGSQVILIDITGKQLMNKRGRGTSETLSVEHLEVGIYILEVRGEDGRTSRIRFMKK